jgi:hypothetical protein
MSPDPYSAALILFGGSYSAALIIRVMILVDS